MSVNQDLVNLLNKTEDSKKILDHDDVNGNVASDATPDKETSWNDNDDKGVKFGKIKFSDYQTDNLGGHEKDARLFDFPWYFDENGDIHNVDGANVNIDGDLNVTKDTHIGGNIRVDNDFILTGKGGQPDIDVRVALQQHGEGEKETFKFFTNETAAANHAYNDGTIGNKSFLQDENTKEVYEVEKTRPISGSQNRAIEKKLPIAASETIDIQSLRYKVYGESLSIRVYPGTNAFSQRSDIWEGLGLISGFEGYLRKKFLEPYLVTYKEIKDAISSGITNEENYYKNNRDKIPYVKDESGSNFLFHYGADTYNELVNERRKSAGNFIQVKNTNTLNDDDTFIWRMGYANYATATQNTGQFYPININNKFSILTYENSTSIKYNGIPVIFFLKDGTFSVIDNHLKYTNSDDHQETIVDPSSYIAINISGAIKNMNDSSRDNYFYNFCSSLLGVTGTASQQFANNRIGDEFYETCRQNERFPGFPNEGDSQSYFYWKTKFDNINFTDVFNTNVNCVVAEGIEGGQVKITNWDFSDFEFFTITEALIYLLTHDIKTRELRTKESFDTSYKFSDRSILNALKSDIAAFYMGSSDGHPVYSSAINVGSSSIDDQKTLQDMSPSQPMLGKLSLHSSLPLGDFQSEKIDNFQLLNYDKATFYNDATYGFGSGVHVNNYLSSSIEESEYQSSANAIYAASVQTGEKEVKTLSLIDKNGIDLDLSGIGDRVNVGGVITWEVLLEALNKNLSLRLLNGYEKDLLSLGETLQNIQNGEKAILTRDNNGSITIEKYNGG